MAGPEQSMSTGSIGSGLTSSNGTELIAGASYTNGDGINVSQTVDAIRSRRRSGDGMAGQ